MRVLYFSRDYTPHDHRFLSALVGSSHQIGYLRLEDHGRRLEERPLPEGVEAIPWAGGRRAEQGWSFLRLLPDLQRVIDSWKPDLIHAGPLPDVAFLVALSGFHPLVSMSWGYDILHDVVTDRLKRWAARLALKRSTLLFADCRAVVSAAAGLGTDPSHCVVFPWGVDLERFIPPPDGVAAYQTRLRKELKWGSDTFVLLSVRSLAPIYGVRELTQAFIRVAPSNPGLRLLVLGRGPLEGELRRSFQEAGLTERVFFAGQIPNPDLPDVYHAADGYVSASHTDGSSISLLEALACGCPALVSDIPGNAEWVTDGEDGWLFRVGDADDLSRAIQQMLENRDHLAQMSRCARRTAEDRADWKKNVAIMLGGYEKALAFHHHKE